MAEKTEEKTVGRNCPACKKIMRRVRRYYRDGAYYCNKNCYKKVAGEAAAAAQPAAA